jgi:hypothetical protein
MPRPEAGRERAHSSPETLERELIAGDEVLVSSQSLSKKTIAGHWPTKRFAAIETWRMLLNVMAPCQRNSFPAREKLDNYMREKRNPIPPSQTQITQLELGWHA